MTGPTDEKYNNVRKIQRAVFARTPRRPEPRLPAAIVSSGVQHIFAGQSTGDDVIKRAQPRR